MRLAPGVSLMSWPELLSQGAPCVPWFAIPLQTGLWRLICTFTCKLQLALSSDMFSHVPLGTLAMFKSSWKSTLHWTARFIGQIQLSVDGLILWTLSKRTRLFDHLTSPSCEGPQPTQPQKPVKTPAYPRAPACHFDVTWQVLTAIRILKDLQLKIN